MINKILLIHPPYISKVKCLPLGVAYLKSFLQACGYNAEIIDMDPMGLELKDIQKIAAERKPDIVAVSFMTVQANDAQEIARRIKQVLKDTYVLAGGVHASAMPEEILKQGNFDFVICGEGEETFKELIEVLDKGEDSYENVKGIAFRKGAEIKINQRRELIEDINLLPFPDWSGLPVEKYTDSVLGTEDNSPTFPILSTRGCPYACVFCASNVVFKRKYRARSNDNIISEIEHLKNKYNARNFDFVDDTLTLYKDKLLELCDGIIDRKLDINWICNARVNGFDEKVALKLKEAGCKNVCFGVESGDPDVWKAVNKGVSREEILTAHKAAKKAGLIVTSFFMVGNIGESKNSIKKTMEFIDEIDTDYPTCSIATPYPGTQMYDVGKANNWIRTEDWAEYVTTPHVKMDYKPIWTNGIMSADEILDAYYYVNAHLVTKKLAIRYGKFYYLNPRFYAREIIKRIKDKGMGSFVKLFFKLLKGNR